MHKKFFLGLSTAMHLFLLDVSDVHAQAMSSPAMSGPLAANPTPYSFNAGPLGSLNVGGILSGLGFTQSHATATDQSKRLDLSNAQLILQKASGPVQFYVQAGGYSLPALGSAYVRGRRATTTYYSAIPVAYAKLVPSDTVSLMIGKLPTLIGAEYTFTFQNMNVQRGLLWNQENAISRGVQANYTRGPVNASVALTDGFYSEKYNWVSAFASYQINPHNLISLAGGGNLGQTSRNTLATPIAQNNSEIYNLMYSYTNGPWTLSPYLQYTHVEQNADLGLMDSSATQGAAILAKYQYKNGFSLAGRAEYITSNGDSTTGAPNLLYGQGSDAYSFTVTPTYQHDKFWGWYRLVSNLCWYDGIKSL